MTGAITWELVTMIGAAVAIAFAVWWRVESRVKEAKTEATVKAESAGLKADLIGTQLAEYKTHVAETYVTKQGMRELRDEVSAGFKDIKDSITGMNERLDRVIESNHKPIRRSGS